ncbi:MAG: SCO family protein [Ktedonobacterales bacterium]
MKLRSISRISVVALVIIVSAVIVIHSKLTDTRAAALVGTDLGATAAPGFTLVDQTGATVSLEQLRGHPVALTFLDSRCVGGCAATADKLYAAVTALGPISAHVEWIGVSVDPNGDTAQSAAAFVASHHLSGNLRYLMGSVAQLSPTWKAYGIEATPGQAIGSHALGVYVIDGSGRERVFLDSGFASATLASDLRALLA